jgi:predicted nucleic acid-binding protein
MMQVLIDTGPWVALLDRSESKHALCVDWFRHFKGDVFSTEAVLTEVLYLLSFSSEAQAAALDFVLKEAVVIVPSSLESLRRVKHFMNKYRDFPMDFADATLVVLAGDLGVNRIFTFDRKHFGAYQYGEKGSFVVVPT